MGMSTQDVYTSSRKRPPIGSDPQAGGKAVHVSDNDDLGSVSSCFYLLSDVQTMPDIEAAVDTEKLPSIHVGRPLSAPPGSLAPPTEIEAKQLREQERARTTSMSSHVMIIEPPAAVDHAPTIRHQPSQAFSIAASAAPQSFRDLTAIYNVVSERRNAFDSLLWQWCDARDSDRSWTHR